MGSTIFLARRVPPAPVSRPWYNRSLLGHGRDYSSLAGNVVVTSTVRPRAGALPVAGLVAVQGSGESAARCLTAGAKGRPRRFSRDRGRNSEACASNRR